MSKTCIIPNCENVAKARGLCFNCYMSARDRVSRGKTTWEFLVEDGLALGTNKRGVKTNAAFGMAFDKAAENRKTRNVTS